MLSTEVHNTIKGKWHVYDNMRVGEGEITVEPVQKPLKKLQSSTVILCPKTLHLLQVVWVENLLVEKSLNH
jgi:hypothetical protein